MPRTPTPVGRAARGIDREAARKHKRRNTPKPLVFPCCLSIDVPDARRPAPTGGGMGASLCASPRLSVLCVKRLSELRPLSVQSATQVDHLISIGLPTVAPGLKTPPTYGFLVRHGRTHVRLDLGSGDGSFISLTHCGDSLGASGSQNPDRGTHRQYLIRRVQPASAAGRRQGGR